MRNAKNASLLRARLSGGGFHSVGLCEDGTAVCWGDNEDGQCDAPPGQFIAVSAGASIAPVCATTARWSAGVTTSMANAMRR